MIYQRLFSERNDTRNSKYRYADRNRNCGYSAPYQVLSSSAELPAWSMIPSRHLHQFVQRQPQVLGMTLLGEVQRQQKRRKNSNRTAITSRGSRSKSVRTDQYQDDLPKVFRAPQPESTAVEEICVPPQPERNVQVRTASTSDVSFGGTFSL